MGNYYRKYNLEPVSHVSAARQSGEISQDGKIFETKYSKKEDKIQILKEQNVMMAAKNYIFKEVALQIERWSVRMYSDLLDYE